jgi:hypothetical protein
MALARNYAGCGRSNWRKDSILTTVYRKFENEMLARTAIELGIPAAAQLLHSDNVLQENNFSREKHKQKKVD